MAARRGVDHAEAVTAALETSAAADDFGHIVHRTPERVVLAGSPADVAAAVRWAAGRGLQLAPRGRGHSTFGRSQVEGGVVVDMSALRRVLRVEGDRVVVEAGATWSEVVDATLARGLVPPVLPDYLELSVGGTLAVGGVGATTSACGVVGDNVLELEAVTGTGERVTCSEGDALFDAIRAGLGQVGVVTRATLRLVPAPESVHVEERWFGDLATMLSEGRRLVADEPFSAVQGAILAMPDGGFTFRLDVARFGGGTLPYASYLERLAPLEAALRENGQWWLPHPWLMTFVGDSRVEAVVDAELRRLDPATDLGPLGQVVVSPIRRAAVTTPLLRLPEDELCWTFNLVRLPATADADPLVEANRAIYERVRAAGGTLYPVSALPLSGHDWREHFGPAFGPFEAARRAFDPAGALTPGYEVFS
jgi:cytokinin dehydrogenase